MTDDVRGPLPAISGLEPAELAAWLSERSEPGYRLRQVLDWTWGQCVSDAGEMRTLPARLRDDIARTFRVAAIVATDVQPTDRGLTEKALHRLVDGEFVESVLMQYPGHRGRHARSTVCISSQSGCAVGCPFCATGELGFRRHLDSAEIADQVRFWARRMTRDGGRLTNVVFMGMGEPLLNLDAVIAAARALTDPARFGLGGRHITVSTAGVVPGIERLAALRPPWTLAVSLHAGRSELRDMLVPINRRYPVTAVVEAAAGYARATGRRVSYEYVMIDGVNDTDRDAAEVARLLRGQLAHVNLIPMNPVAHTGWRPSPAARVATFAARLEGAGIPTTVRRTRGDEIGAACGQLVAGAHAASPAVALEPMEPAPRPPRRAAALAKPESC
jgi:23S rRNA (adenine2503-C2)-methyltransferase